MCRLIPAFVEEEAWINLAGEFQIDMQVEVKVHKVRRHWCNTYSLCDRQKHAWLEYCQSLRL